MAITDYRLAAATVLSTMLATGALLCCAPAGADDPEQPAQQGQDACAAGDQGQPQDPQACGAGIANRVIGEGKNAANQAERAGQSDQRPNDLITDSRCIIFNGAPTLVPPEGLTRTATPFDSPMEGKPCWAAFGVAPTH